MTAGPEPQDPLARHGYGLTGSRVAPNASLANSAGEVPEFPQFDPVALRQTGSDRI